ncbi:hypothetical protein MBLNU459_g6107t1 [Dothideomycetes sp. NU459]
MADKEAEEKRVNPETAPDPDEDDLSDLDDMLDEFSSAKIADEKKSSSAAAGAPAASGPPQPDSHSIPTNEDDFAKQLQEGMASLLGQLDSDPDMQKQFESMMKELGAAAAAEEGTSVETTSDAASKPTPQAEQPKPSSSKKSADETFQDTIRKTMERMQNSGETASAKAASSSEDDMLAQMLKEMESGSFPGMDGGNEEDFNKMLMGMMEQLTNKEILYDPMKELHDKFPTWLRENRDKTPSADLARYEQQQKVVSEIVARFERKEYSDDNKDDREYIVERMQQMQAAGSPPPDLVGDMSAAQEALGDVDAGCPQQ